MKLNDCIYFLTTRLSRELRKQFDEYLYDIGLTASGWCVLMCVIENEEKITQREIAEILCLETPTVTRILDILQKNGFIDRIPHPDDRRCFLIKLTEKGNGIKDKIFSYGKCFMEGVTRNLDKDEIIFFKNLLNKIYEKIKTEGVICKRNKDL